VNKIDFFKTDTGKCPVEDFLDTLSDKQAKKIAWVLRIVRDIKPVPSQYFKKLVNTDDIWEVCVSMGNNIFRLLGFYDKGDLIILTNGFQKKTQETPRHEIELAEKRKKDYLKRRNK
jgi:phage-related protein